ncbi:murein hydrolase activator EnvC family protein [Brevirhabdus sp.]|uniref:murein hydrolase activator EnvC family protein n=1 Tax=Brevirhabdus sp. TaxID=2004514 RepID=UPI0040587C26
MKLLGHILAIGLLIGSGPGSAARADDDPSLTAQRAAQMLARAGTALSQAEGARDRVRALTQTVRAYEEGLLALRDGLRKAAIRERTLNLQLEARRERIGRLLGTLQTIERAPAPLLMLHPTGPVGTARSAMIVAQITPALQAEADTLKAQLDEIAVLRVLQQSAAETLTAGLDGAQQARVALSRAIADRTDLPRRFEADPATLSRLITSSDTLDSFANGLSTLTDQTAESAAFSSARGSLPLPVEGTLLRGFDEADAAGVRRPGIVLAAPARALVSTPWPATIRYLGPLLDYGNVIILEPGAGYLMVLAGLAEVYGAVGEILPAGTPVGLMGGAAPDTGAFLSSVREGGGVSRRETLYIEIRQAKTPMDPAEWFELTKE